MLAVVLRVAAMLALSSWNFDSTSNHWAAGWETGRIANSLAAGQGYVLNVGRGWTEVAPSAWLAPLYPTLVAGVFAVLGSFTKASLIVVLLFQILCDAGTCLQLTRIGRRLEFARAGLLGGLLFALSPASINMSVRVLWCTSLLTFLGVTLVLRFLGHAQANSRENWKSWALTGALIGLTLLTSPTPAFFVGLASLVLIARNPARNFPAVSTMALVACVLIGPWILRNRTELGALFFIKSNIGNELFIGNNPIADGAHHGPYETATQVLSKEQLSELASMNELERAERLGAHATSWISAHPAQFARLSLKRFWTYWSAPFLGQWELLPLGPLKPIAPIVYGAGRWLILAAGLAGAVLLARKRRDAVFLLSFLALFPVAYYVTHAGIARYRFPVLPYVFLLAAISFDLLQNKLRGSSQAEAPQ